ncbi:RNA-binding domain-containing protein [Phlegmacium glaucopus]|nr:RNA-binding domain-containing protein [Phlegmacium glaucopus]
MVNVQHFSTVYKFRSTRHNHGRRHQIEKTVFVGGISEDTDETTLYEGFSTFGDIIEVQLPPPALTHYQQTNPTVNEPKHRGFAFITFGSSADAQDAIDNMDMNELKGRVLKVNLARPMKGTLQPNGNLVGPMRRCFSFSIYAVSYIPMILLAIPVWESD